MSTRSWGVAVALACALAAQAADQVWNDGLADNIWSTNAANWDAGAAWENDNSAVFSGGAGTLFGEAVDVAATVTVANVTFQTNGYVIADAEGDGALSVMGAPSVFTVVNAGDTGTVSVTVGGSGGLTKAGYGVLNLTVTNAYAGSTTVSNGVLRLARAVVLGLGLTGAGNNTEVAAGATLDLNGCYVNGTCAEKFTISGDGADRKGALINTGSGHVNRNLDEVILLDDAVIGGPSRIDIGVLTGNGKTLTKTGAHQLCMRNVANVEIVINEGNYTLLADWRGLGGTTWGDTTVKGGTLYGYGTMTVPERITFDGGTLSEGGAVSNVLYLTGHLTVNSNVVVNSGNTFAVDISGYIDGAGGFTQANAGWFILSGDTNTYAGPTIINANRTLSVGKPGIAAGGFGSGVITNNGNLHFDRSGSYTVTNALFGTGNTRVRYGGDLTLGESVSTTMYFRVVDGTLTLTNGASLNVTNDFNVATRSDANYTNKVLNFPVTAVVNVTEGTLLNSRDIIIGNGDTIPNGLLHGTINQYGGVVSTYGATAENNGIRVAHWPLGLGTYNMRGGTLLVDNGWDLCIATDGTGWVHQTGGEIYASRVMLNERSNGLGFGRLTVEGGVLNIGLTNGILNVASNGIAADSGAPYLVEYGGRGGVVRAVTNFSSALNATLAGTGADAITFDTREWRIDLSGTLAGEGGLNKAGSGVLALAGLSPYSGETGVGEGSLLLEVAQAITNTPVIVSAGAVLDMGGYSQSLRVVGGDGAVSNGVLAVTGSLEPGVHGLGTLTLVGLGAAEPGGTLTVDVTTNGASDVLHVAGDLSLAGMSIQVVDAGQLNKDQAYTVVTCDGELSGLFASVNVPEPWYVFYDWARDTVQLRSEIGTLLRLR